MIQDELYWERLQALFHLAENTPDAELEAFLTAHGAEPDLRQSALDLILASRTAATAPSPSSAQPLSRIGPYTVVRHLGSGGIGAVYLVERLAGGSIQRSALKVLSLHAAGPFFTERFTREQHILASLHHPNITRMEDAGLTEGGQPYLVMEYIEGVHLDTFCDDRALPVPSRLKLFQDVCEAVAYAHRNLIVHLDLKPSNILVTTAAGQPPTVKLLDFGTSKLIQPDASLTTTVMATPAYASPEQLRNDPVTTSCDVYALGAILFELLCGRRPNQDVSVVHMIERSLKELPPESLPAAVAAPAAIHRGLTETRLRSLLTGDLATIAAKCLNPRPRDRYASVDALITDLDRYQQGRPILARPQTTTYRLSKFVRRNRTSVLAAGLAVLALIATLAYASWRQHQAVVEGRRALQMQTFIYSIFKLANPKYTGKPSASVKDLLQLGVRVLPDFIQNPTDQRAAQLSLAESMFDSEDLPHARVVLDQVIAESKQGQDVDTEVEAEAYAGTVAEKLGDTANSRLLSAHALSLSRSAAVRPVTRVMAEVFYADERENTGEQNEENLRILQQARDECHRRHLSDRLTAFVDSRYAGFLEQQGKFAQAEPVLKEAIAIYQSEPYALYDQAETYGDLAYVRANQGDLPESIRLFRQAYDGLRASAGPEGRETLMMQAHLAGSMLRANQAPQVSQMLQESMPAWRRTVGNTPDLANPLVFLVRAYLAQAMFQQAEQAAEELFNVQNGKIPPLSYRMGVSHLVWAQALAGQQRYADALPQAVLAQRCLPTAKAITAAQKQTSAQAEELLLDLQKKIRNKT